MFDLSREKSKSLTPPRPTLPQFYVKEETPPRPPPVMILNKRGSVEEPLPPRPPPPFLYTSTLPPPAPKKYRSKSNDFKSKTLPVRKLSSGGENKPLLRVEPFLPLESSSDQNRRDNKESEECAALSTLPVQLAVTEVTQVREVTDAKQSERNNSPPSSQLTHSSQPPISQSETIFLTSFRKASQTAPKNSLCEIGEISDSADRAGMRVAVVAANGVVNCLEDKENISRTEALYNERKIEETGAAEDRQAVCLSLCSPGRKTSSPTSVEDNKKTKLKNVDLSDDEAYRKQKNVSANIATDLCPEQMKSQKYPIARESLVSRAKHESQEQLRKFKKNVCMDDCKTKCSGSNTTKLHLSDNKSSSTSSRSPNRISTGSTSSLSSQADRSSPDKNKLKSVSQPNRMSPVLAIKSIMRKSESDKKKKKREEGERQTERRREPPLVLEDRYNKVLISGQQRSHSPTPSLASTNTDTSSLAPSNISLLSELLSDRDYHNWLCSGLRESKNNFKDVEDLDRYVLDMIAATQDIKTPRASLIAKDKKSSKEFDELIKILSYKKRHSTNFEMKKSLQIIIDFIGDKKDNLKASKQSPILENSIQSATSIRFIEPRLEEVGDCFLDCQLEEQKVSTGLEDSKVWVNISESPQILVCSPEKENRPVPSPRLKRLNRGDTKSPTPSTATTTSRVSISSFNSLIQDLVLHTAGVEQRISGASIELKVNLLVQLSCQCRVNQLRHKGYKLFVSEMSIGHLSYIYSGSIIPGGLAEVNEGKDGVVVDGERVSQMLDRRTEK